jgi:hypothetical protein
MKSEILEDDGKIKEVDLNRRKAIRACCLGCSGYEYKEVRDCTHLDCPLYNYRTGKGKQDPMERDRALKAYCMWCTLDQPREISLCPSTFCPLYSFRGFNRPEKKPEFNKKTSPGRLYRHYLPEVIPDHSRGKNLIRRSI